MYCVKCGKKLEENEEICTNCGYNKEEKVEEEVKVVSDNEQSSNTENIESLDERLIKTYIGKKSDKMYNSVKDGGFNIWAILFGVFYFAYRKMLLVSIISIIVLNFAEILIPSISNYLSIFVGLLFCPLYKWDITRKLRKIKTKNPNASEQQLLMLAKGKGGTSVFSIFVFLVLSFAIMSIMFMMFE